MPRPRSIAAVALLLHCSIAAGHRQSKGAPSTPPALGFVELDDHAIRAVKPAAASRAANGDGVIIPLFSNRGFMPFLRNLICSMKRLKVRNYLVIAMDNATCPALMDTPNMLSPGDRQSSCVYPYSKNAVTSQLGVATYRSVAFNRMVMQRPLWVRWLLQQGYSVIQCDLDIVWLQDPHPLLRSARLPPRGYVPTSAMGYRGVKSPSGKVAAKVPDANLGEVELEPLAPTEHVASQAYMSGSLISPPSGATWKLPDMLFQSEQAYGLNGGFYFARPTNNTLAFFGEWIRRLTEMINLPSFEEQHALNSAIVRVKRTTGKLVFGHLHERQFPNGKIWWSYPWLADKRTALIVHSNWNKQQKKARMLRDRLWFLSKGDGQCAPDFDPLAAGCSKLCAPVAYSAPGSNTINLKTCWHLQREDDYQVRKHVGRLRNQSCCGEVRGLFWHPLAYETLHCTRNLSLAPLAHAIDAKLRKEVWHSD